MNVAEARGILIACVMEADGTIRRAEVETGAELVARITPDHLNPEEVWMQAILETHQLPAAIALLLQMPEADRLQMVEDLWALCDSDDDISVLERGVVVKIAAALGVSHGKGHWPDKMYEVR